MKKLSFLFLSAAAGLIMASCSQEEIINGSPAVGDTASVSFKVNLPDGISTRAIGDGTAATNLQVIVFEAPTETGGNPTLVLTGNPTFGDDNSADVNLDLVTGKSYQIAFFATSGTATSGDTPVYSISTTNGCTLTVNYDQMNAAANNADAYDCFYSNYTTGKLSSTISEDITLTRPVAQVNWGTTPITDGSASNYTTIFGANGAYMQATLNTTAYKTLNLLTGAYSTQESVTLLNFTAPTSTQGEFPEIDGSTTDYNYVAMQYLLVPATSTIVDLTLSINNAGGDNTEGQFTNDINVASAPVQANYKTNIYGNLLTGNVSFNVTKGAWNTNSNTVDLTKWDGTTYTYPTIPTDKTTPVVINHASDIAGLAQMVSGSGDTDESNTPNTFEGYTIELAADFDMGGEEFPAFGSGNRNTATLTGNSFKGVFDGKGHTISNLTITGSGAGADDAVGFIAYLEGEKAALQNVTFENVSISGTNSDQVGLVGILAGGATVSNVKVNSGSVKGKQGTGAIVGRLMSSGTISQCENAATVTSSGTNTGGIVGAAYRTVTGQTITISECTNTGDVTGANQAVGGIAGLSSANISNCTNKGAVTNTAAATGGIVGQQVSAGTISGCTNNGTVTGSSQSPTNYYGAGGIVGWVRYQADGYEYQNVITVTGCTNTADVSGPTGVGGIVGSWYQCGVCTRNSNTASHLTTSTQYVAGIVGGQQWIGEAPSLMPSGANTNTLFVNYNYSSTPVTSMTGGGANWLMYVNSPGHVDTTNNSESDPNIVKQDLTD